MTDIEARVFLAQAVTDTIVQTFPDATGPKAREVATKLVDSIVSAYVKLILLEPTQEGQPS